ncbi:MMPL family transporter [Cryobacterium adonitolivorans]|uniref:MMPL family transporter n=1 Tax=Cryobacterium adonitolivorans TaxID=1259189 RepID=A0A4R8W060_9MICO|nr:MMPL family transporter [Cryobacterium adonitolivorans]TFB99559.1 MMPL family transporter [Cryobacterium adonitolivorans]
MLRKLGVSVARHRLIALVCWAVALAACVATALLGGTGESLFQRLSSAGPSVKGEAQTATDLIEGPADQQTEFLSLLVHPTDLGSPDLAAILDTAALRLEHVDGVSRVVNPLVIPPSPAESPSPVAAPLLSADGEGMLFTVAMETTDGTVSDSLLTYVERRLQTAAEEIGQLDPNAQVEVGGAPVIVESLVAVAESDLQKGELIALPIALLVMLIIFGGFLAAGIPLVGAIASIIGALGMLYVFTFVMDIGITVMNVITVIGLGLSIDYGLLMVSRFREEFRARVGGGPDAPPGPHGEPFADLPPLETGELATLPHHRHSRRELMLQAVGSTVNKAGRTVLFSGLTFAIATAGLLVFEPSIIRAIAIGAICVVLIAILTALVLVPALLGYLGERLVRPGVLTRIPGVGRWLTRFGDIAPEEGVFSKLARLVQRAPALVALGGTAVLLLLSSPVLSMTVANSADDAIPRSSSQYDFITALNEEFPLATAPRVLLVSNTDLSGSTDWANDVADLPGVTDVAPPVEQNGYWVSRVTVDTHQGADVVREIRADPPAFHSWVAGADAQAVDYLDSLARGAPWAVLIIAIATFVLLFLMTGSVIIPLTALVISAISLGAAAGVLVWGFQEGNLSGPLNFDPDTISGVDALVLTLVLTFGFGLAMDYEMFLLARIKEHHDRGESTRKAIETGLQSSGRIITSAALIIVLVFAGFATGELMQMKQIGTALAVAVLLDATLVRIVLVPAVMTSLERVLWWAPRWSAPIHTRFGLSE